MNRLSRCVIHFSQNYLEFYSFISLLKLWYGNLKDVSVQFQIKFDHFELILM